VLLREFFCWIRCMDVETPSAQGSLNKKLPLEEPFRCRYLRRAGSRERLLHCNGRCVRVPLTDTSLGWPIGWGGVPLPDLIKNSAPAYGSRSGISEVPGRFLCTSFVAQDGGSGVQSIRMRRPCGWSLPVAPYDFSGMCAVAFALNGSRFRLSALQMFINDCPDR